MNIKLPEYDWEATNPEEIRDRGVHIDLEGCVEMEIALEIAKAVETIMIKHGKKTNETKNGGFECV